MPESLLTDLPDAGLVEAARQGGRPAFDVLVERLAEHAWRLVGLVLRNGPAAEEVLRESVLASWRTLPAYSGDPGFGTWLDRTALTRSLRVLERTGEARQLPTAGVAAPELALLPPQELADRVLECRNRLPGGLRAVLVLLDAEGRPLPEVEVLLGAPQSALRQRLWRARTLIYDEPSIARTGVTVILPREGNIWKDNAFARLPFLQRHRGDDWRTTD